MKFISSYPISKDIITGLNRTCNLIAFEVEWYSITFEFSIYYLDNEGKRLNNRRITDYTKTIEINLREYKAWHDSFCYSVFKKGNVKDTMEEFVKFCDKTGLFE